MMYCRFCGAEMADDQAVCASCGKANDQVKKPLNWKPLVAAVCCVALIVGLVAAVWAWMASNDDGILTKESYYGTDAQVKDSLDTVVATAGEFELTNRELQVAYWYTVYDFLSYYGDYVGYMIDFTVPLDQQMFNSETNMTWQHYFLDAALKTWHRYEVLAAMAEAEGHTMSQELQDYFATLPAEMEDDLATYGYDSIDEMVTHDFGAGTDYATYEAYMKLYYFSGEHYDRIFESLDATDAEIEAYYATNKASFEQAGYTKEAGSMVTVRHILLAPGEKKPYTDAQWADAEAKAQDLLNNWLQGAADEDSFAALAKEHSACSSAPQGGLIENIVKGQMVQEFEDWCMEPHEYGDYGIVKTTYGYHLMFYVEGEEMWYEVAKSSLLTDMMGELLAEEEAKYPLDVDFNKILLADVPLA